MPLGVDIKMVKLRIAVPTKAYAGLDDVVSEVFGKTKTFTIVEVENGQIRDTRVIDNPAASYEYGSGPVAVKTLADFNVDFVLAAELGPGASGLLEHHHIKKVAVKPNAKVADIIKENLAKLKFK
jgi:predicted Fe-Mo cluster-binding NifX family protein